MQIILYGVSLTHVTTIVFFHSISGKGNMDTLDDEHCDKCKTNPERKCRHCGCQYCGGKESPETQLFCEECQVWPLTDLFLLAFLSVIWSS